MRPRLSVLFLIAASPAWAEDCPPARAFVPDKVVTLSTGVGDIIYTGERSRAAISALSGKGGLTTLGLTQNQTEVKIIPQIWSFNLGGGRYCAGLGRVEASWRITKLFVDIASEFPPGGCNYRVIRDHENQHVAFAHATFQDWAPRIKLALQNAAAGIVPRITKADPTQTAKEIEGQLMAALRPAFDGFAADLKARNASIDTMENYRQTATLCPKW
jgi:hypothetical protein